MPCFVTLKGVKTDRSVLMPLPGRVLMKFAHSKVRYKRKKQLAYVKTILLGYRELDAIPFMAAWRLRLLNICDDEARYIEGFGGMVENMVKKRSTRLDRDWETTSGRGFHHG